MHGLPSSFRTPAATAARIGDPIPGALVAGLLLACIGACGDRAPAAARSEPDRIVEWMPERNRCRRYRSRRYCDGPRRVPRPHGAAAARAERLELGNRRAASRILSGPVPEQWRAAAAGASGDGLLWPVPGGQPARGFGHTRRDRPELAHDGVDIAADEGTPILAVNDGLVVYSDNGVRGMGNLVMIVHPDGSATVYAHLRAALVFAGQRVKRGQRIGEIGNTGLSRGPHLHFEWRVRGRPRNPAPRFVGRRDGARGSRAAR